MNVFFQSKSVNSFQVSSVLDSTQSGSTTNLIELSDLIAHDLGHDGKNETKR